jgi:hypothetical protein
VCVINHPERLPPPELLARQFGARAFCARVVSESASETRLARKRAMARRSVGLLLQFLLRTHCWRGPASGMQEQKHLRNFEELKSWHRRAPSVPSAPVTAADTMNLPPFFFGRSPQLQGPILSGTSGGSGIISISSHVNLLFPSIEERHPKLSFSFALIVTVGR